MLKLIVSINGVVIKEIQLIKDRTTLGRRPYNDVVIDNLLVSGEHAAVQIEGAKVFLEDLNSTNGSYVNGKTVKKQLLRDGDIVEIGKCQINFVDVGEAEILHAVIKVLSGAAAGREVPLIKAVTTIGKPGVAIAAITRHPRGFVVHHVEGTGHAALNANPIGTIPLVLKNGDLIELAGTRMRFVQT